MRRISITCFYNPPYKLEPGRVDKEHLDILIDISPIRSGKIIIALSEYYINGMKRRVICEKYGVNPGYLSLKIREVQDLNCRIYKLLPFYIDKMTSLIPD
ncbi:adhesin biosynthesis transcription regulatory family protein [Citrobacter sp. Cpo090]|uniref:PapB/FocB family fimbrial expression transcriptional regulator n=1 Tax=Citrobacter sp. Cpo090 TaxID=2985139 RepID=UPI0025785F92|nr:PapB/FocB family fimbrial expression transcriptional regulator [Citrobacter sp. Cpo090]MDM2845522.1 adhesin biosynthesis transcription regulatory family protein [Citrobacter sp. Cpo090]